ncbi:MAG: hypothetical protein ACYTAN_01435 [Planctomycetota bacterium]|jgi:hypothetical protein
MKGPADGSGNRVERDRAGQWPEVARKWRLLGPPLRPSPEDVRFCEDAAREWIRHRGAPRVLLLGVTPELYHLPWPEGTDLLAVDRTRAMIEAVWPGPREAALCEDWLEMNLPGGSRDIVLCDGGLNLLAYPGEQRRLAGILRGVLSGEGLFIFRLFVPPAGRESTDMILKELLAGEIPNLNILKLRLWAALQNSPMEGVELDTVWRAIHAAAPDLEGLASRIDWPLENTLAINAYRGSTARYYLGTVDDVTGLFCGDPGGFEVLRVCMPSYEGGERCPTVVLRRCSN